MKPLFLSLVLSVSIGALARATESPPVTPLALETLVAEIVAKNPELAFYAAEIDAAKAGRRVAGALADPSLSVEAGRKRVRETTGVLAGEGTTWSVSVAQAFEWPGRLALRKSIANRQVELAELGLERFKHALAARARVLATGLQAATDKATAAREVAERYEALRNIFLARDPAGMTPLLETRVIEAQELALRRRATEAALAQRQALVALNQLRGASLDAELVVAPTTNASAKPDADMHLASSAALPALSELVAAARERNFEFRLKRVELEQQGLEVSLARHERYPTVTVSPFYSREKAGEKESTAGVGISLPLPLTTRTRSAVEGAEARRRQAEAALQVAQRELERDVVNAAQAYTVKTREIASWAPDAVTKFREAAALADRHYRLGAVPLATYVELQGAYLDAVDALVDTQREALEAALTLQQLTGLTLDGRVP